MIKRSTVVMVVLLALLAGLAYYLQQPNNPIKNALAAVGTTPTAVPLGSLLPPNAGPLGEVQVQSADGQSVTLLDKGTGWLVAVGTGQPTPADQSEAEQAVTQALSLSLANRVQLSGSDLSPYGLDKPAYTLMCVLSNGSAVSFKIGKQTVTGSSYYVMEADGSIVTVDKTGIDTLIGLIKQPPFPATATSPPVTETATSAPTSAVPATETPITELTPTKQP